MVRVARARVETRLSIQECKIGGGVACQTRRTVTGRASPAGQRAIVVEHHCRIIQRNGVVIGIKGCEGECLGRRAESRRSERVDREDDVERKRGRVRHRNCERIGRRKERTLQISGVGSTSSRAGIYYNRNVNDKFISERRKG